MGFKYDKDSLKENLSIEEVFDLVAELGGEPKMNIDSFTARTICHGGSSHKLYYYANTHLFHCYTECGDASFDIYELVLKINKNAGRANFSLAQAIIFVAKYFGYSDENFEFENNEDTIEDWKLINIFKRNKEKAEKQRVELKIYEDTVLQHLPRPHIIPWEEEDITFNILNSDANIQIKVETKAFFILNLINILFKSLFCYAKMQLSWINNIFKRSEPYNYI